MPHSSWRTEDASGHRTAWRSAPVGKGGAPQGRGTRTALSATSACVPRAFDFNAEDRFQPKVVPTPHIAPSKSQAPAPLESPDLMTITAAKHSSRQITICAKLEPKREPDKR